MTKPLIITAALSSLLAGCVGAGQSTTAAAPAPANYREAIVQSVKETFFDPYSIRDAAISQPMYATAVFDGVTPFPKRGWIVCVRANAKNRMGGYTGLENSVFLFDGDRISDTLSGPDFRGQVDDHCADATFEPFTEIEAAG